MLNETQRRLINEVINGRAGEKNALGLCRTWTDLALNEIEWWAKKNGIGVFAEAREVVIRPGLDHTFVRAVIEGFLPIVMDGTGVESFPPYYGLEDESPEHLRNSKIDTWIMSDRASRV